MSSSLVNIDIEKILVVLDEHYESEYVNTTDDYVVKGVFHSIRFTKSNKNYKNGFHLMKRSVNLVSSIQFVSNDTN